MKAFTNFLMCLGCIGLGIFLYQHFFNQPVQSGSVAAAQTTIKDNYTITDISSNWSMADDGNPTPETTFTITNTSGHNLDNVYIEVHFLNTKTNQDYGWQNDSFELLKGSNKKETIAMENGTKGISLDSGSPKIKAVIEIQTDNNDLAPVKNVMLPEFP